MQTCPRCGGALVVVSSKVGEHVLTMLSCSSCDVRQWRANDEPVELSTVIDLTAESNPRARPRRDEPAADGRA